MTKQFLLASLLLCNLICFAQTGDEEKFVNYGVSQEFEIGGITVSGTKYLDESVLITLSGLQVGDKIKIPGEDISKSIQNLWKQGLFADVKIYISKTIGKTIFLEIKLQERPRLCSYAFVGAKKQQVEDLRDKIRLIRGKVITENLRMTTRNIVLAYFRDKGYLNAAVEINETVDTTVANCLDIMIVINKGKKVKIAEIAITGNLHVKTRKVKRLMKGTKQKGFWKIFTASKFMPADYRADKISIIEHYNTTGFRDSYIAFDTTYMAEKGLMIALEIDEGSKYFFRNITWKGNSKFSDEKLQKTLGIEKGEIYDNSLLDKRLFADPNGLDVSSLYMDDGYLFFQATPVEVAVENDSIDLEIQIYEGAQATINQVIINGNTKTNEHVIRRELRTIPGNKFSRSDIIRSQREIASLGYFNAEALGVMPIPHPESGTVDIEYDVEEKPADQVEMSMGWGGIGLVGSFGVSFTNFSVKNIFKRDTWSPLPAGDGQRLSIRAQANARFYRSLSASFTEPWLGGKKPNSFTISAYRSAQSNGVDKEDPTRADLITTGGSIGLGIRLSWPDDFFILSSTINLQNFNLQNWFSNNFILTDGSANNISLNETLSRNSLDQPIYPRYGSMITLSVQATPPYSLFNKAKFRDPNISDQDKYRWIEYHKYRFGADWYTKLVGNLVLKSSAKFGFLAFYNPNIGPAPFERFEVGGNGLTNFSLYGVDIISSRGYDRFTPDGGYTIFDKFTLELRYPLALKPMSTIYVLGFAEGVNAWSKFNDFDPFKVRKSVGLGLRLYLPMFGLLGFDYGIGIDNYNHTETFGQNLSRIGQFNIILGFEPE